MSGRPNRKPCIGVIQTDIDPETKQIIWWCQCVRNRVQSVAGKVRYDGAYVVYFETNDDKAL